MVLLASWTKHGVTPNLQGFLLFVKTECQVAQAGIQPVRSLWVWPGSSYLFAAVGGWSRHWKADGLRGDPSLPSAHNPCLLLWPGGWAGPSYRAWRVGGSVLLGLEDGRVHLTRPGPWPELLALTGFLLVSGIYDLEPLISTSQNDPLHMTL